ncbi:beta-sandwich lipoprotein [Rhodococcus erythropolis]|uniref:beta-sandwich lipoprotein n=1 Tax=Rhodococcus erythropolis TaxID=1833 RepID=UPI0036735B5C
MNMKKIAIAAAAALAVVGLTSCTDTDADVVSENLSKAADQFEIERRIVFFNGITDTYLLTIEGRCSIDDDGNQLEVTCKTAGNEYKKHFLGLSDNVSYVAEQIESANVSADHYRVIFKPEVIIPDIDRP